MILFYDAVVSLILRYGELLFFAREKIVAYIYESSYCLSKIKEDLTIDVTVPENHWVLGTLEPFENLFRIH